MISKKKRSNTITNETENITETKTKTINENIRKDLAWPASLVATNNSIIITTGEGSVNCFDLLGNLKWSKNFNMSIRTSSYLMNNSVIIFINNGELIALNPETGEERERPVEPVQLELF